MTYRAVIFDLFGTLIPGLTSLGLRRTLAEMAGRMGLPAEPFTQQWFATFPRRAGGDFADLESCLRWITATFSVSVSEEAVAQAANHWTHYVATHLTPYPGVPAVLAELRRRERLTGVISNCSAEVPVLWPGCPLAGLIDQAVFSCLVGLWKPDPRIYRLAVERLGVESRQCLYVGDGDGRELNGAVQAGIATVVRIVPPDGEDPFHRLDEDEWDGPRIRHLNEILTLG